LAVPAAAHANVDGPGMISVPGGELPHIAIYDDLRCAPVTVRPPAGQVFHADSACATLASVDGVLYGSTELPGYSAATQPLPNARVWQFNAQGDGSPTDATQLRTEVALGATGIHLIQVDSYAAYADNWRTDIQVRNEGNQPHHVVLYRVGDCASGEQEGGWL